jgi:hypothetical protein
MRTILIALALVLVAAAPAGAIPMYATNGSSLVRFDSTTPSSVTTVPITGLPAGEALVGIDVRPATAELYGVGSSDHLFRIDPVSGAASLVSPVAFVPSLSSGSFGTDFNPVTDRIRVVSSMEQNLRLNPDTGALAGNDTDINPAGNIVAVAHTNSFPGATTSTLYAIDSAAGTLRVIATPNSGTTTLIGSLGVGAPLNAALGLDAGWDGKLYASILVGGVSRLYTVSPSLGTAVLVGPIGDGTVPFLGIAAAAPDQLSFTSSVMSGAEGSTPTLTVRRANPTGGAMVVSYAAAPGTADASDHGAVGGTISWAAGDSADKTIALPLAADGVVEVDETFTVGLSGPAANGVVVSPATATVTITDVPPPAAGPPVVPLPRVTPPVNFAPRLTFARIRAQRLRAVLAKGLAVSVSSNEPCRLTADLLLDAKVAKRLKLARRVARISTPLTAGKAKTIRLRPGAKARGKLRGRRSVRLTAELACIDPQGAKSRVGRRTTTARRP